MNELYCEDINIQHMVSEKGRHQFEDLADIHFAQLRSYLKATGLKIGLLLNFAKPTLEIKRIVN